jgi:hypothetical protein
MHYPSYWASAADRERSLHGVAAGGRSGVSSVDLIPVIPLGAPPPSTDGQNGGFFPSPRRGVTYREELEIFIYLAIELLNRLDGDPDLEDEPIEPSGEEDTDYPPFEGTQ